MSQYRYRFTLEFPLKFTLQLQISGSKRVNSVTLLATTVIRKDQGKIKAPRRMCFCSIPGVDPRIPHSLFEVFNEEDL